MLHKLIPYIALIWAACWYVISLKRPAPDTGNDVFARLLSYLGWCVFIGWGIYAIWQVP